MLYICIWINDNNNHCGLNFLKFYFHKIKLSSETLKPQSDVVQISSSPTLLFLQETVVNYEGGIIRPMSTSIGIEIGKRLKFKKVENRIQGLMTKVRNITNLRKSDKTIEQLIKLYNSSYSIHLKKMFS